MKPILCVNSIYRALQEYLMAPLGWPRRLGWVKMWIHGIVKYRCRCFYGFWLSVRRGAEDDTWSCLGRAPSSKASPPKPPSLNIIRRHIIPWHASMPLHAPSSLELLFTAALFLAHTTQELSCLALLCYSKLVRLISSRVADVDPCLCCLPYNLGERVKEFKQVLSLCCCTNTQMHKYKYNTCLMGEGVQDFMQMLSLLLQIFHSSRLLDLADFASKVFTP